MPFTRNKKFRPPLKSGTELGGIPEIYSVRQSQLSTCTDSVPATQTHTVLSYCDNYEEKPPTSSLSDTDRNEDKTVTINCASSLSSATEGSKYTSSSGSESEDEEVQKSLTPRFRAYRPDSLPLGYSYSILPQRKRTLANMKKEKDRIKCVQIASPKGVDKNRHANGVIMDLSVYDYQPTPPEARSMVKKQRKQSQVSVPGYCSSREEQVSDYELIIECV